MDSDGEGYQCLCAELFALCRYYSWGYSATPALHAQVAEKATRDLKAAIQKYNDKTHVRSPIFQMRDDVLVAEHRKSGTSKLQVK
jgi:hypothetical protein